MKTKLFFVILFFAGIVSAQSELWPTANAEWHYTHTDDMLCFGFTHYKIERDTSLLGKNGQIYSREYKTLFTGLPFDTIYHSKEDIYYIIGLEDSVLYNFNFARNEFDTIINFKANIGDMWKNYYTYNACEPDDAPPYFWTKVLNKEIEVVNGLALLKFTLERSVPEKNEQRTDVFYQLIGSKNGNFIYNKICFSLHSTVESKLRCFSHHLGQSDEYTYKTVEVCDSISKLDVKNEKELSKISVVNPVLDNVIRIKGLDMNTLVGVKLFDNLGKELKVAIATEQDSYILTPEKHLTTGIYFCALEFANGQKQTVKISIYN